MKKSYIVLISICSLFFLLGIIGMIYKYTDSYSKRQMHPVKEENEDDLPKESEEEEEKGTEIDLSSNGDYLYRIFYSKYDKKYDLVNMILLLKKILIF